MQPVDLAPSGGRVRQQRQYDIQGIEHNAPGPHSLDLPIERRQHSAEIETPRLDQVRFRLGVYEKKLFPPQFRQFPAKAFRIGHDALRGLLKSDKDARLPASPHAMYQELQREYGLARTWSAHQKRRTPAWQTS